MIAPREGSCMWFGLREFEGKKKRRDSNRGSWGPGRAGPPWQRPYSLRHCSCNLSTPMVRIWEFLGGVCYFVIIQKIEINLSSSRFWLLLIINRIFCAIYIYLTIAVRIIQNIEYFSSRWCYDKQNWELMKISLIWSNLCSVSLALDKRRELNDEKLRRGKYEIFERISYYRVESGESRRKKGRKCQKKNWKQSDTVMLPD